MATESQYVFALEVLTTPPGVPIPQGVGDGADRVITASRNWVSGTNVVGTGVSIKQTAGTSVPDQWAFKVYVKKKLANNEIPDGETVPPVVEIPGIDEPIVTDVVEIGTPLLEANTMRTRPLMAGYSTGLTVGETGTIGCFVSSRDDPHTPLILSNSHVIANYGMAGAGAVVVQPGRKDGGTDADEVGKLVRAVEFEFAPGFNNLCDAAVAGIADPTGIDPAIPGIGVPQPGQTPITVGMQIQKSGRTTGLTTGIVQDAHFRTYMLYPKTGGDSGNAGFRDQVLCTKYSGPGDSGSLVCDMQGNALGLHWAGSESTSIFSPIALVFDQLGIQLWSP